MPTVVLTVRLERDGVPVPGYPLRRQVTVPELQRFDPIARAADGSFRSLPIEQINTLKILALRPDRPVTVRLSGQTSAGIPVKADGLVLFFSTAMIQPSNRNASVRNDDTEVAYLRGVGA